ncbi:MAG: transposase [Fastidiosipila sp.]|nr:transposase [Fastidiosipila sp.]
MSNILSDLTYNEQALETQINLFFKRYISSKLLKRCGFYKKSGFSCMLLLKTLFSLVFKHKNLWRTLETDTTIPFAKNTVYRFLNQLSFHWEKFLLAVAAKLVAFLNSLTDDKRATALVIDDSPFCKNRSKKVELLSRFYDHTSHKFQKGYRMLTVGWTDGSSFVPVNFRLLSSAKEANVLHPARACDRRSQAYNRRLLAQSNTTDVLLDLLRQVRKIPAKYVLFDSWFTMPKTVSAIISMDRDVIGMVRITENIHYCFNGKWQHIKDIYSRVDKNKDPLNPIIGSANISIRATKDSTCDEWIKARLIFVRNTNRKDDAWLAILCTDVKINNEEAVRIYGKRWDIEVFFKMCKSYLALGKESQGRSYDAQVAATSIVFLRYMMIAESVRLTHDEKTWGEVFFRFCDEVKDIEYVNAVKLLINTMIDVLRQSPVLTDAQAQQLIDQFWDALPFFLKERLQLIA